ncbi:MAG TPA: sensor histidine kinase [Streptosporangiaceae bacterium]|jgi:signal transduction histidine kinase
MTVPTPDSGFEAFDRRADALIRLLPYPLLAAAMVPYALSQTPGRGAWLITLAIALAAAGWIAWMRTLHPGWAERRALMAVYFVGLLAVCTALVARSPWFAFFCWIGYIHAYRLLPGRWRYAGVVALSALVSVAQVGGFHRPTPSLVVGYLLLTCLNGTLVVAFSHIGEKTEQQNKARKQMIAELAEANYRLEEMMAENTGLHAQLLSQAREAGVLEERQRMAREIHDTLAQGLTGIVTQLEAAGPAVAAEERQRRLGNAKRLARDSLAEARRSVQALRPEPLETALLPEAVTEVADRWSAVNGVAVQVTTTGSAVALYPDIEIALLRVAQEALANVAKHAGASRVGLTLSYMEDVVTLDVRDDGKGFCTAGVGNGRASANGNGFGLTAMRQRVERLGGRLAIESEPGNGTAVSASVPAILRAAPGPREGAPCLTTAR